MHIQEVHASWVQLLANSLDTRRQFPKRESQESHSLGSSVRMGEQKVRLVCTCLGYMQDLGMLACELLLALAVVSQVVLLEVLRSRARLERSRSRMTQVPIRERASKDISPTGCALRLRHSRPGRTRQQQGVG